MHPFRFFRLYTITIITIYSNGSINGLTTVDIAVDEVIIDSNTTLYSLLGRLPRDGNARWSRWYEPR